MSNLTHGDAVRTAIAALVTGGTVSFSAGTGQKLIGYSGTPPASAGSSLSGNTAVFTITGIAWGAPSGPTATVSASTDDPSAVGGIVTFYRIAKTDGTVIHQGLAGTSGAELTLSNTTVAAGAIVSLNPGATYTACP